jgi:alanyl-tRNA synthetase
MASQNAAHHNVTGQLSGAGIRQAFIDFFSQQKGHQVLPSASLVPSNPTVLLTPAGMLPFVPIFLGIEPAPTPPRVVSSQKCARVSGKASDLEAVGRTPRHHTFFEMLGNFSFGDYFKHDVIPWSWAFLTQQLKLSVARLWVSVYETDDEAYGIWRDVVGVPESRILRLGKKDNFWGPPGPTGPCGPCSEIYYDLSPQGDCNPLAHPEQLDGDDLVEVWNLVFMELFQDADGHQTPLEKKNVDTGMGLERIAMVVQGKQNTFETDLLYPILHQVAKAAKTAYKQNAATDVALKIVTDHVRCITFALADGITPSNEGRGYVIRMILRRAVRYGKQFLGFTDPFLYQFIAVVRDLYGDAYPELRQHYAHTVDVVKAEERKFLDTLEKGSRLLDEAIDQAKAAQKSQLSGDTVFKLYDTYGFPVELTTEIAAEHGLGVDHAGFEAAMAAQKTQARGARKNTAIVDSPVYTQILSAHGPTQFLGYDALSAPAKVIALLVDGVSVPEVSGTNTAFEAILDQTPFYAESGGQVGDHGTFSREDGHHGLTVVVNDTQKVGDLVVHHCLFDNGGTFRVGESLIAQVEPVARDKTVIHHTAAHLLQAALIKVLGDSVHQAGSSVRPDGTRFDFTFHRGVTAEELARVEYWMNAWIMQNIPGRVQQMPIAEAKSFGAIAMVGEKYAEVVRVVSYGQVSKELCGGTHVTQLGQIGMVKIVSEGAIAAGVRRIELVAGELAYKLFKQAESDLKKVADLLKAPSHEVPSRVEKLMAQLKEQQKALSALEEQQAMGQVKTLLAQATAQQGVLITQVQAPSAESLKLMAEQLSNQLKTVESGGLVLLGSVVADKVALVCAVSDGWQQRGIKAGDLIKQVAQRCGGGGGGRPNFAQAGGSNPAALAEAIAWAAQWVQTQPSGVNH